MPRSVALVSLATAAALVASAAVVAVPATAATADTADTAVAGAYVPVGPTRVVDTATGAYGNHQGPIGGHRDIGVTVSGADGVPADAAAVVLSISVSGATKAGALTVSSPSATSAPTATTVSFAAGQNVGDLAIVPVVDGHIHVWNTSAGSVSLTADVSGYYTAGTPSAGGSFHARGGSAGRVVDTRHGTDGNRKGAIPAGGTISPHIAGLGGVPSDARAVAVTVTAIGASAAGTVSVRTSGGDSVPASLQVQAHRSTSQLLVLPLSAASGGKLAIANHTSKALNLAVDVSGWYLDGAPDSASITQAVEASTVVTQTIGANSAKHIVVAGRGGVPRTGVTAAVVTLRVEKAATYGTLSAASGAAPSVVQFSTGSTRSGEIVAAVDSGGRVTVANHSTKAEKVAIDVDGYVPGTTVPAASETSVAHYLAALKGTSADPATMRGYADADAAAGVQFVLFDVGAQSITGPQLSAENPGVSLANTAHVVRLPYATLVTDLEAYTDEYAAQAADTHVEVAVGTNNDGDFDAKSTTYYAPAARGSAWATQVIRPLRSHLAATPPDANVTALAADDIEYGFSSTEAQAWTWENHYLSAIGAGGVQLIYNGDANSCPRTPGTTGQTCTPGWTQTDYYELAYNHGHVRVLPQVFYGFEGARWANIDATGSGSSRRGLTFVGALTDHSRAPKHLAASDARATLYRALSSVLSGPQLAAAVDFG
ncbi:hypothetical protein [Jatrophihabitans endophyticus]|uniref:hypothetical protein n=1 Tax=Jatrophihabitans endophyticus TaxID=1206085 RepID=UPI001A0B0C5B|nr:hypothetical protein [Jatrophihabitans endophyticus]MBE7189415.1 hypothetical protein [Jatrophihabitans endophyticus]